MGKQTEKVIQVLSKLTMYNSHTSQTKFSIRAKCETLQYRIVTGNKSTITSADQLGI